MPDPDRNVPEMMDAPGTRATPEPDEHANQLPGQSARATADVADRAGASIADERGATTEGSKPVDPDAGGFYAAAHERTAPATAPVDEPGDLTVRSTIAATEGGTGTSGSRGGGPAADFSDQKP